MLDCTNRRHWRIQRLLNRLDYPIHHAQCTLIERQRVYNEDNKANRHRAICGPTQAWRDLMRVARRVDALNARKRRLQIMLAEEVGGKFEGFPNKAS